MTSRHAGNQRIVMVVDNAVLGDSRVIKSARSAKAAGYEVLVLGHGLRNDFEVGGVQVELHPGVPLQPALKPAKWIRTRVINDAAMQPFDVNEWRRTRAAGSSKAKLAIGRLPVAARWRLNRFAHRPSGRSQEMEDWGREHPSAAARLGWWDQLDPWLSSVTRGLVQPIIRAEPDLIHAHDYRVLPAVLEAAARMRTAGRIVSVVYDAHEYIPGLVELGEPRRQAAMAIERSCIHRVDAVITVSEALSKRISAENRLPEPPVVVRNCPEVPGETPGGPSLRARVGVASGTPLLVYAGSVGGSRLLRQCVACLTRLPDAHLALVVSHPTSNVMQDVEKYAAELGVAERLHLTRYVPAEAVVSFLAGADIGLAPIKHTDNVQDSLPTKTFEYLAAGVPQAVSDLRELAEFVRAHRIGEVFVAESLDSMTAAIGAILATPEAYRAAITPELIAENSWATQAQRLIDLYSRLLGGGPAPAPSDAAAPPGPWPTAARCSSVVRPRCPWPT